MPTSPPAGVDVTRLPEAVQLRILGMVAGQTQREPNPASAVAPPQPGHGSSGDLPAAADLSDSHSAWALGLALRLSVHGFAWQDEMVPRVPAAMLLRAARALPADALRAAGMSSSVAKWHDPSVRGDSIAWVPLEARHDDPSFGALQSTAGWSHYRAVLRTVVDALNREGGVRGESLRLPDKVMLAHYPEGARYIRHSDASPALPHRRVTVILYLSEEYDEAASGGRLRLWHRASASKSAEVEEQSVAIEPHLGRLLLFHAQLPHEVETVRSSRWALTAWLSVAEPVAAGLADAAPTPTIAAPAVPPTPTPTPTPTPALPSIFVSVASYRDPETPFTLRSIFERAAEPARVVVGVCYQVDEAEDEDCVSLAELRPEWRANVRTIRMAWREAKGPVWARHLIQRSLLAGEDYFLQLDSHTRLAPRWDVRLIAMLGRCGSPKPVLTTYPLPYEGDGEAALPSEESRPTLLCTRPAADAFGSDSMLRFRARLLSHRPASPPPTAFWAAGFSFSSADLAREVPYDPHLPFLFFGEEISIAVRMWTRGWDLFAPDEHVVYHKWSRTYRTTFWEVDGGAELRRSSQARVRRLLTAQPLSEPRRDEGSDDAEASPQPPPGDPIWGIGTVRSIGAYERLSGVDLGAMAIRAPAERGGMPDEDCFWDHFAGLGVAD